MFQPKKITMYLVILIMAVAFMGCASTPKQSSPGDYIDDTVITTKVKTAIFDDPVLKVMQISVETRQGIVQLSGFVDTAESVTRAGQVARDVAGVKSVKNDLIVK